MICKCCKKQETKDGYKTCEVCLNRTRRWRESRKKSGLCECGKLVVQNKTSCQDCLDKEKVRRENRINSGLCATCNNLPENGKKRCQKCLKDCIDKRKINKSLGMCGHCGKNKIEKTGYSSCDACLQKRKDLKAELAQLGICVSCLKNSIKINSTYCENCLLKFREIRKKRSEDKVCLKCGDERINDSKFCEICYLKEVSYRHFSTSSNYDKLKHLFNEQNGRCVYSGVQLTLGLNAELDHKIPSSKGGSSDLDNLQWTHKIVNRMKLNFLEDEFLKFVNDIYHFKLGDKDETL